MNATFEPTNSKSRVLIVDDNSRFARSARLFLEHTGNYFACAVNDPGGRWKPPAASSPISWSSILSCHKPTASK